MGTTITFTEILLSLIVVAHFRSILCGMVARDKQCGCSDPQQRDDNLESEYIKLEPTGPTSPGFKAISTGMQV
ncbi:uncharacterized protein N7477_000261 [Penicillium maclennaniae]|uniref:uncharacterized protein n=1 Tax=Penicillium maclennaniae TaxID=1343394 RepID=UPI002540422D|nr:uncharacterized protein N7477_000261 [Penicillium maclennaniae]KAJ5683916.1 hypothetical protein N7477_000261 [Penicillium maclennaniae]